MLYCEDCSGRSLDLVPLSCTTHMRIFRLSLPTACLNAQQETVAAQRLQTARASGGWVLLQNIHLMLGWTSDTLTKFVDRLSDGAHPDFRWEGQQHLCISPMRLLHCNHHKQHALSQL